MTKGVEGLLADALAEHDALVATCPLNDVRQQRAIGVGPCTKCRSTTDGPCWVTVRADARVIEIARSLLASPPSRGGEYTRCTSAEAASVDRSKRDQQGEGS